MTNAIDLTALPDNATLLASLDCERDGSYLTDGVDHITWSRWTELTRRTGATSARWFIPSYLACGDYNNTGLVERSNLRVFKEQFSDGEGRWWLSVTGDYGTDAVVIRTLAYRVMRDVREFFDALSSYPLADDGDHSDLEQETQQEDWSSYGRSDFKRAMAQAVETHWEEQPDDVAEQASDAVEALSDAQIDALYHELCGITGTYPESESSGGASLFHEDRMASEWAGTAHVPDWRRTKLVVAFEVPRLVNGAISYACGDVVAWRGLLETTDEPRVRCTEHSDCASNAELAALCHDRKSA